MSVRPYRDINRRRSRRIQVGAVAVGGGAPISVQSMTNTLTTDVEATIGQIRQLEVAGADIVRVHDVEATRQVVQIAHAIKLGKEPVK